MRPRSSAMARRIRPGCTGEDGRGEAPGPRLGANSMIDGPLFVLVILGVLGTGLTAGVFVAFSTFVMR